MTVGKGVELTTRKVGGVPQLAVLVESAEAAEEALTVLADIEVDHPAQRDLVSAYERALAVTRDRWMALEREAPASERRGHTIDPATGGLNPTWSPPPAPAAPVLETSSPCDWLSGVDVCEAGCEVTQLILVAAECGGGCL